MTLQARNLTLARGGAPILTDVSLTLAPGALVGLLGANGAGKSTLLAALAGELAPRSGQVFLGDADLATLSARQLARRRAVLPQKPSLSFDLGVSDVVGMGAYPFPELDPAAVRQLVRDALEQAGVTHLAQRRYPQLSGGEQQRVQFARVLAQCHAMHAPGQTRYLMLDEPISNLDPRHQMELLATARALAHEAGMGVLVIVHDINQAARWCDTLALLADGRLAALGPPADVLTPDHMRRVYGIEADVLAHPTLPGRLLVLAR
ncbi:hemin ABC transporter ATP-binding protein [Bordetella pertussis]|uniref:Hemin import ATP-binding protein HmuV n=25 Tax=Alcaligenaceae TaxID=506 RepID=HMUV_BORPE|nr:MULTISPECIES: heme ABC transporter ATP-binding protein [Bordetella]Q7W025.1 RecName: Full=Hemin import ATP-binding protein HmuV [Bordetella pertussis Tohama I]ETH38317.1 putative iron(III) dicitrate ABC transporter, ATP-binding protein FecE [Bordetella pertussis H918]ETH44568.1 putative iron(III) dicitrate ABC transporter, ATP-binding protein FecE [Bordetella pertussis H939]ETH46618.1 putative iron(III) dicitrate ABC transporter, ATP-binding protein FecE [Bordetella pertussis H921]ETH73277.